MYDEIKASEAPKLKKDIDFILVASGCANDVVKATWLNQMGYTLKKQNPNWIANR